MTRGQTTFSEPTALLFLDSDSCQSNAQKQPEVGLLLVKLFQGLQGVNNQDIILSAVQYHLSCRNPKIDLGFFNRCLKLASDKDSKLVKVEGGKMGAYIPMVKRGLLEGLAKGRQEGIAEGRQEGMEKGMEKGMELVAHNMLKENMNIALISQVTGLSQDHILKLKSKT